MGTHNPIGKYGRTKNPKGFNYTREEPEQSKSASDNFKKKLDEYKKKHKLKNSEPLFENPKKQISVKDKYK